MSGRLRTGVNDFTNIYNHRDPNADSSKLSFPVSRRRFLVTVCFLYSMYVSKLQKG